MYGVAGAVIAFAAQVMRDLISHIAILKSVCRSQLAHKSVNLFVILVIVKNMLTDLWVDFCKTT